MDEASNTQSKNESLCKVCGDKASGKHYGVPSCDGCRGFFKRSIRRNLEYVCKENGRCVVDVTRRNQCQACRFKKCLHVNMKRDAVQHERAPRSIQTGFHHHHHYGLNFTSKLRGIPGSNFFSPLQIHSSAILEPGAPIVPAQYLHQSLVFPSMLGAYPKHNLFTNNLNATNISYLQSTYSHHHSGTQSGNSPLCTRQNTNRVNIKEDEVTSSEEAKNNIREPTLESNSRLELPTIGESTTKSVVRSTDASCMSSYSIENIYESAAKLLFLALKWAKTIPSFLQLSCRDQSILLEESWNELFILTAAQWDLPIDENFLVSNVSTQTSRNEFLEEDARKLRDIINRLNLLRVDHTEHACLKALVLFKSESRGLCEPVHVELLQDQTHVMLHEYCIQKAGAHKGRFGKLLLSLPAVQAVSKKGLEELLFKQTVGDVSVDRILMEIAKIPPISAINQHN